MKGIFLLILVNFSLAAEPTRCWRSLPASTVGAIEIDLSDDLLIKLRQNTLLGKTILTKQRLADFFSVFRKHSLVNPKLATVLAELRSSGFSIDEMTKVLNSKFGVGLIPEGTSDQRYWSLIAWVEMKPDLAAKIISSLKERDPDKASVINDLEVLTYKNDWGSSFSILAVSGNKLLMVSSDIDKKYKTSVKKANYEPKSHELCIARFKKFTHALQGQEAMGFYAAVSNSIFIQRNKLEGRKVLEYHANLTKLFEMADDNEKKIELAGLKQLKMLSGYVSLKGNRLNSKFFLETEGAREGLVKLIDQPQLPTQAAGWVTSDINSYTHMSLDVKFVFDQLLEVCSRQFGEAAVSKKWDALNTRARAFLAADLKSILSSFGHKVIYVDYGLDMEVKGQDKKAQLKSAIVIPFDNTLVSNRILEIMTPFAEGKGILRKDQLGFKGFRVNSRDFKGSFYIGQKKLILTTGLGVSDKVLKSIITAPKESLASSKEFIDFQKKLGQQKSTMLTYGNLKSSIGNFYDFAEKLLKSKNVFAGMDKRDKAFIQELLSKIPTKTQVLSVLGVAGAYTKPTPEGLEINGFMELP